MSDTESPIATEPEASPELAALLAEITEKVPPTCARLSGASDLAQLEELRVEILGRKGLLADLSARMGGLSPAEKPIAGKLLNNRKTQVVQAYNARKEELEAAALNATLAADAVDITLPGTRPRAGSLHPITQTTLQIEGIFRSMGFRVERGPEIENEWFNFDALNMPADHPARDMQDTFHVEGGAVLRTHTSPTQLRAMMTLGAPLAVITTGRVYRCE